MVAETFICHRPEGMQVNHKDGNKRNNHPSNLEWATLVGNVLHAHANGLIPVGVGLPYSKLTEDAVRKIRAARGIVSQRMLAYKFGVNQSTINRVQTGRNWRQVRG